MTFDTNILIAYLSGEDSVVNFVNDAFKTGRVLILPAVVLTELLSFPDLSKTEITKIESFLFSNFVFVPLDKTIASLTSSLRRNSKVKTPDATIAATALYTNTPLVTRNVRDFKNIEGLTIISI